jgi:DMSO/TMAO reductase YedYZ molybdopterin-dependent catalytic subunit
MSGFVTRGFGGRRRAPEGMDGRLPPGQHYEPGFPVLTAGVTPRIDRAAWSLRIDGLVARPSEWSWEEAQTLPQSTFEGDIHCVTTWSKLGTSFTGVSVDELLDRVEIDTNATHVMAHSYGGYTTNLPLEDVRGGKAWIAFAWEGEALPRDHGGPARLLVPHLYFWKSAKWVSGLRVLDRDEPGFWEQNGYHMYGDPWREQRFAGD